MDAGIGRTIHRRLEAYRLPRNLVGTETPRGPVPARLTPIFRDREELSAGESLSEQVQAALAASECLIVLCSPNAKASKWVTKEIETFRALHPERPVLAALIAGEPHEAFPAPLTDDGAEPVWADFRKGEDGAQLAFLKLVAGITGVALDSLVQRDAQRKLRSVMAVTLSAIIGLLLTAGLLIAAIRARAEADRQRTEAEGLVEFMLTDLRDRLKGVGRLDVMTAVNERAMGYYGGDSTKGLLLTARTLHALGEDDLSRGNATLAGRRFSSAYRTTSNVLVKLPRDPDAVFAHAQSEYWVGYLSYLKNDRAAAGVRWTAYRDQARALTTLAPSEVRSLRELGYAEGNLCSLAFEVPPDPAQAKRSCKAALDQMKRVVALLPDDVKAKRDVANRTGWMAQAYQANIEIAAAMAARTAQAHITEELSQKYPDDLGLAEANMAAQLTLSGLLLETGDVDAARERVKLAKSIQNYLHQADPSNIRWKKWESQIDTLMKKTKGN